MTDEEKLMVYAWGKCSSGVEKLSQQSFTVLRKGSVCEDDDSLFLNALIKIGNTEIEGAVKIIADDKRWKMWHSLYKSSVVLVVSQCVTSEYLSFEYKPIRTFVPQIKREFINRYNELLYNKNACGNILKNLNSFDTEHITSLLVVERMNDKCENIASIHKDTNECWSDTALAVFFDTMMISDKKGRANFRQLVRTIGYNSILKNLILGNCDEDIENVEALFLGAAGFLSTRQQNCDKYTYTLREKFEVLRKRYNIVPMAASSWPSKAISVPLQLAQMAAIIVRTPTFHYELIATDDLDKITSILKSKVSEYWFTHKSLGVENGTKSNTQFSKFKVDNMVINFVVPYLFFYNLVSVMDYDETKCERLLDLLHDTDDEKNGLVDPWRIYFDMKTAFRTQAVTQISKKYCTPTNCYKCLLGRKFLDKYDVF
ncbi:MAG: DUF2851 family protein [Rikenellaceae bacterium]